MFPLLYALLLFLMYESGSRSIFSWRRSMIASF
eukprot:SAG31_NODE_34789_length_329_cov_0.895652_1_plen_32_part_01